MIRIIARFRTLLVLQTLILLPSAAGAQTIEELRGASALNVSIAVFDPGIPADLSLHRDLGVFPRIREIEVMLLPFVLRETLANTKQWGAVRVVPKPDVAAELLVTGTIIRSDGEKLELKVRAVDASGRVWLDREFTGVVSANQKLYDDIAENLRTARAELNDKTLTNIVEISLLRYANQLVPSVFGGYLSTEVDDTFTIARLPARNDPMFDRIKRIRSTEHVITDTVDAKFRELHTEIASIYDFWREYRRKVFAYQAEDARHAQSTKSAAPRGSYDALENQYDNYKWDRITAQEQDRLAVAFNNEVGPTVDAMEARVAELTDWVELKYAEWRRRAIRLIEAEAGLLSEGA